MTPRSRPSRFFYRNFAAHYRFRQWQRRRFTNLGRFVIAAAIGSGVAGVNTRLVLAYQIFALLLALLCVSLLASRRVKTGVRIQRFLPRYACVGEEVRYRLRIMQKDGKPLQGLSLLEIHHDPRPDFAQFCDAIEPGAEQRNAYDRMVGFYRWSWLVRLNEVAHIDEIPVPALAADAPLEIFQRFTPYARGTLCLSGIALARRDPLGLCRAYQAIDLPGSVLVLPRTYALPPFVLPGSRSAQPEHRVSASGTGDGDEISGLRGYRPGDPLRDIHWKSFARTGVPVVKEYQPEFFERHALLLDTLGAPAGAAFEDAVALAASFVGDINDTDCLLDLLFAGTECFSFTMGPGELQAEALLRVLAGVRPGASGPGASLRPLQAALVGRRAELSGCICILLAWDQERARMVEELRQLGLPLLLLLVCAQRPADCPSSVALLVPGQIEQGLEQISHMGQP